MKCNSGIGKHESNFMNQNVAAVYEFMNKISCIFSARHFGTFFTCQKTVKKLVSKTLEHEVCFV